MIKSVPHTTAARWAVAAFFLWSCGTSAAAYRIAVSNEKSGDITVIDGGTLKVLATIPVGKRPRGIHVSHDGKTIYVALSGTPVREPPPIDAQGNPVLKKKGADDDDDDDDAKAEKSADGIGVVDLASDRVLRKLSGGSDPEEFDLSKDGPKLYTSNEDFKASSVIDIASGKVEHLVVVGPEPEGVATSPDGKRYYVTCEASGEVHIIDTGTYKTIGKFKIQGRPRSIDFLPGGPLAIVPSESAGQLNIVDTAQAKVLQTITMAPGSRPMKVKVAPDGKHFYVSNGRAGTVTVYDSGSYALQATIKVGARPWGLGFSPDGKYLFAANGPSNDISVVDVSTNKEIQRVAVGDRPWGVADVPGGN